MNRDDIQKLLGGYATGTLTPEEQQALFEAALTDQEIFDALAKDQPLHDLLQDPGARAHLLAGLDDRPDPWYRHWWRPVTIVSGSIAVAAFAILMVRTTTKPVATPQISAIAEARPPAPTPQPASAPARVEVQSAKKAVASPVTVATGNKAVRQFDAPIASLRRAEDQAPAKSEAEAKDKVAELATPPVVPLAAPQPAVVVDGAARGGGGGGRVGVGGVMGGIIGGVPSATPTPPPPPAKKEEAPKPSNVMLASSGALTLSARALFYGTTPPINSFRDATTQSVEVQSAPVGSAGPTREAKRAAPAPPALFSARTPRLGIRYTIERKTDAGAFEEADPDKLVKGDTIQIRFEANQNGFLYVLGASATGDPRPIAASSVQSLAPFTTPPLRGEEKLTVVFSRRSQTAAEHFGVRSTQSPNVIETTTGPGERFTYIVNPAPAPDLVTFTIFLTYK